MHLALAFVVNFMIDHYLVAKYLRETFYIFAGPGVVHFAVAAKFVRHQIVRGLNSYYLETIRMQLYKYFSAYILLCISQKRLNITHHRVMKLSLMQPVAIE